MKIKLSLFLTIFFVLKSSAQVLLPYSSGFENEEGFVDGAPLSGDWTTTSNSVVTTNDQSYSGAQSIRIPLADPENIISIQFDPSESSILFVDYYMQLTASDLLKLPSFTVPETTALLAVQANGSGVGEWTFLDGDGAGSGLWFSTGDTMALDELDRTGWRKRKRVSVQGSMIFQSSITDPINVQHCNGHPHAIVPIDLSKPEGFVGRCNFFSFTKKNKTRI